MAGKRLIGGRKDRKILIISEDEKSFILYFEKLLQEIRYHKTKKSFKTDSAGNKNRITTIVELIHIRKNSSSGIVNEANEKISKYEKIFCVFDAENEEKRKKDLEIKAEQNVEKIISIPCYEAWLLMHFTTNLNEDKFLEIESATDLVKELSNQYRSTFGEEGLKIGKSISYEKNWISEKIFKWFYANLNTAKANAQRLRKENKKHLSTEIDLLINELENFSVA
jgi:hypothetical protein